MYVCVCNAITERQIRSSVESGSTTLADLQFDLGVATCCGSCADTACQYLPAGASACEHAYEASISAANGHTQATELPPPRATTRRFPIHVVAAGSGAGAAKAA
ncbi:MAG: hypothetical protein ABS43_24020 [Bordetella sp. SCN 67-23]|mgnify:FL=1|nr:(2Fe-2S)-binding protein [Burkholderiales bacterium]ODS70100.1 MAG: hypothetical protein ABS43_24020 [Bordetella sp. SCN 67-23]OJW89171.1 MAG: hypothetical protein BGO71_21105 [Burkholderiales bacterium 67-32]